VATSLGTLSVGFPAVAEGINNAGQVVGNAATAHGLSHAFLWQNGAMIDLGSFGAFPVGGSNFLQGSFSSYASYANGINDLVQVLGDATNASNVTHAILWNPVPNQPLTWSPIDLGTLGGTNSYGYGINDLGQVVGYSYLPNNSTYHAFLWQNGVMTDLSTLGGTGSVANSLNDLGQVVGFSYTPTMPPTTHFSGKTA